MATLDIKGNGHITFTQDGVLAAKNAKIVARDILYCKHVILELIPGHEGRIEFPPQCNIDAFILRENVHLTGVLPHATLVKTMDYSSVTLNHAWNYQDVTLVANDESRLCQGSHQDCRKR